MRLSPIFFFFGPWLAIVDNKSVGGKIAGATLNGAIAAALVLLGIWGFSLATNQQNPDDPLQSIANEFGETIFGTIADRGDLSIQSFSTVF